MSENQSEKRIKEADFDCKLKKGLQKISNI